MSNARIDFPRPADEADKFGRNIVITNALGIATIYEYDVRGNKTYEGGGTYPVSYAYDDYNVMTNMTMYRAEGAQNGDTTRWLIDEATGLVTNKVYADGLGPTYSYTPDGKLATRTWARGIVTTYSYDANGSLTNTIYSDSTPTISLVYNRSGRQIEAYDAAGVTTFAYDEYCSLTNETVIGVAGTNVIERYWGEYGRSLGYSLNGTRQSKIGYDSFGRISSMLADGNDTPFTWNYLSNSDLKSSLAYPNGLTASWQYDANGQLLQVRNAFPTNIIWQYDYTYDAAGRRSERYNIGSAFATPDQIYYDYNERSELTNAVASIDSAYNFSYGYDEIGNRLWSVENMNETAYTANNLNQYTAIEEDADTFVPQFDADGNQTLIKTKTGIWQATYNGENRPVYWSNSTTNIVMSFDRMGRRVQYLETAGATTNANNTFTYDNYLCIARHREQDDGTAVTDRFIWDPTEPVATRPLVFNYATAPSAYYTHDGNKNVSELVDGSEDVVAHYEYEAFGAICVETGDWGEENTWRFSSEYGDSVLGLVYYNYRHYEPTEGRWLSRDPIGEIGSAGLYVMLSNSSKIDFLGLLNWSLFTEGAFQFFTSALATTITIAVVAAGVAVAPATGGTSLAVAVAAASAIGTVAWNGMNIGNGIVKILKATQDEQNYDDMQLQCLYWTIEKIDGDPLSEKGLLYTRIGYTAFDMLVGSKSVKVNAKELYQETVKIICQPQKQMILEGPLKYLEVHTFSHEISIRIDVTDVIDLLEVGAEGGGVLLDGMQLKEDVNKLIDAYSPQTE